MLHTSLWAFHTIKHNEKLAENYFDNDTIFNVGNYKFETFYAGEWHTKDNLVVWFEKYKILYDACLIKSTENENLGYITDSNIKEWAINNKKS